MKWLQRVLLVKIVFTAVFWCAPLLFFPEAAARWLGIPAPRPALFARLLGAAFGALLVGYVNGLRDSRRGLDVKRVVLVGAVSNGLAFLLLLLFAGEWRQWGGALAQAYLWASTVVTFAITLGLVFFGLMAGRTKRE